MKPIGAALLAALAACGADVTGDGAGGLGGATGAGSGGTGGSSGAGGEAGAATVTYERDVQPFLARKCSPCHTTQNLAGHNGASSWADTQKDARLCRGKKVFECMLQLVSTGGMPLLRRCTGDPARDAGNDACLTAAEHELLRAWVEAGGPER